MSIGINTMLYMENEVINVVFLGKVKQPSYCMNKENEQVEYYHIVGCHSNYRVGDNITIFGTRLEVYQSTKFQTEEELSEYLDEHYPNIKEL